jgi:hypothetical protein
MAGVLTTFFHGFSPARKATANPRQTKQKPSRHAWSDNITKPDKYGFVKFKNVSKQTLTEADYAQIIDNEERWRRLSERMNADFLDELDMFPFSDGAGQVRRPNWIEDLNALRDGLVRFFIRTLRLSNAPLPQRFHRIQRDLIERRFPGGRAHGDPGDGDIRDMLSEFREMYESNLAASIAKKRGMQFHAFLFFALFVFAILAFRTTLTQLLGAMMAQASPAVLALLKGHVETVSGVIFICLFALACWVALTLYRIESEYAFNAYTNAQTESCKTLDKQVALRTKNLSNLVSTLTPRIDQDRAMLNANGRRNEWPERSRKWVKLVYWLGKRQEALERFAQVEIWSIRRTHYFFNIAGSLTSFAIVALSLMVTAALVAAVFSGQDMTVAGALHPLDMTVCAIGVGLVLLLIIRLGAMTRSHWNTPLGLIEENLDVSNWDRLHSVRLQDRLAEQVFKDKQSILHHEEMVTGKNR